MDRTEIKFLRQTEYKFVKALDRGGFGETILIKDEVINEIFVCKKYSPLYEMHKEIYFKNFIDEIKLLYLINHKNIVRIFNYHLYSERFTGYILMEFINGNNIQDFIHENPDKINDIFVQAIEGFEHLENNGILHRDIRPQNILVSNDGFVKIIDFGFGKQILFENENFNKSISLNWRYTPPIEFNDKLYDFKTELYFVGKLFEELISENQIETFLYNDIIRKMISFNYEQRISSFFEIRREILKAEFSELNFKQYEKNIYQEFADNLILVIVNIYSDCTYITDLDLLISRIENVYNVSMLENYLQNNSIIVSSFLKGGYKYSTKKQFSVRVIKQFINFFKALPKEKQKIVLNNIWQRLESLPRFFPNTEADDLPF